MDLDASVPISDFIVQQQPEATILCCNCGAPIDGQAAAGALCSDCVRVSVDISQGVQRESVLHTCRDCEVRYT